MVVNSYTISLDVTRVAETPPLAELLERLRANRGMAGHLAGQWLFPESWPVST